MQAGTVGGTLCPLRSLGTGEFVKHWDSSQLREEWKIDELWWGSPCASWSLAWLTAVRGKAGRLSSIHFLGKASSPCPCVLLKGGQAPQLSSKPFLLPLSFLLPTHNLICSLSALSATSQICACSLELWPNSIWTYLGHPRGVPDSPSPQSNFPLSTCCFPFSLSYAGEITKETEEVWIWGYDPGLYLVRLKERKWSCSVMSNSLRPHGL